MDNLKEKIQEILKHDSAYYPTEPETVTVRKVTSSTLGEGVELELDNQYETYEITFQQLKEFSELFGTDHIDMDGYCNGTGCDTCGYGSSYIRTIQIYKPTKNDKKLKALIGAEW